jgi:signal peptidase I
MARSAARTARWSRTTAGFAADLALYIVISLAFWLTVPLLVLGWTPVLITSGSMSPAVEPGDVLLVERGVPEGERFVPGTIITYEDSRNDVEVGATDGRSRLVTHRVDRIDASGAYVTRGDANRSSDPRPVEPDQLVGAARLLVPYIGLPVHWARDGRVLMLGVVALALASTILVGRLDQPRPAEQTRPSKHANPAGEARPARRRRSEGSPTRRHRPSGASTDPLTVGSMAARAARAGGVGAVASSRALARNSNEETGLAARRDQPRRRRFGSPPAGAILGIVALSFGALAPSAEAAFLDASANDHNRFATATASFGAAATIILDLADVYCAEVTVTTDWPSPVVWEVDLDLGAAPLDGSPFSATGAEIEYAEPILTAVGSDGNTTVAAATPATWSFCANRLGSGEPDPPTMVLPELGDGSSTAEPAPGPGAVATYSFTFTYAQDIHLDGIASAELFVERDAPGNSPGHVEVHVLADDTPIATGSSGDVRGDGWQTVAFPLDDLGPISETFPAGTVFRVDVELWRVRMELGGASQILLPLAE